MKNRRLEQDESRVHRLIEKRVQNDIDENSGDGRGVQQRWRSVV